MAEKKEHVGSFNDFRREQPGISEQELIVGYTKRLIDSRNITDTKVVQTFDVGQQAELSKIIVEGI